MFGEIFDHIDTDILRSTTLNHSRSLLSQRLHRSVSFPPAAGPLANAVGRACVECGGMGVGK